MRPNLASRLAVLLLVAVPLAAAADTLVAGGRSGAVVLRPEEGSWRLSDGRGSRRVEVDRGERADSVAPFGDGWLVAGTRPSEDRSRVVLRRLAPDGETVEVAAPATEARLQHDPQLVSSAAAESPTGLAWLEGDRPGQYAVRYAVWDGTRFAEPVTVAGRPASGSALALSVAGLADGRTLLVWAGYDGEDDEIWAAVGRDRQWSAPFRVADDNSVPDITPVAIATGEGAVVAWSRFDGLEYRLASARFDGRAFGPAAWAAPPGSAFPSAALGDDGSAAAGILFRDTRSRSWGVVEIEGSGRPGRVAKLADGGRERPLVRVGGSGASWELTDRSTTSPWE